MNVMLLAAGRSTRLGALGAALPKPLLPICGYPAIAYGVHASRKLGTRPVVNLHHHGDKIRDALGDGAVYSVEHELLGTGGGLARARPLFGPGPVLVMNAKVVAELDLPAFIVAAAAAPAAAPEAEATMLLRDDPDPARWGAIGVDGAGRVVSILDATSPRPPEGAVTLRMFTGIHLVTPALLDRLRPVFSDVIRDAYIPALRAGATIRAVTLAGYFAEHSTPERYLAGNLALLRPTALLSDPPGPLVGVDAGARVHPGARVIPPCRVQAGAVVEAGAVVGPEVVLGTGSRVAAGVRLTRAVVWPGAAATADATDSVITPEGVTPLRSE
jgi:NDP-sugar pyrophosphorylase family protein